MNDSLRLYVQKITKLPTLPVVAQEILKILEEDATSAETLERIILRDPPISAKILSVANSAFFGFKTQTVDISSAIVRIGFSNVKNIALGISLMTVLEDRTYQHVLDYTRIFDHSTSVALTARHLVKELNLKMPGGLFIIGMLHDIGFLVLNRFFSDSCLKVIEMRKTKDSLLEAEAAVYGFTHADIGTWLIDKWNLPEHIVEVVRYHHTPVEAKKYVQETAVIHIADYITSNNIKSVIKNDPCYPLDPASLDILGISEGAFSDLETRVTGDVII